MALWHQPLKKISYVKILLTTNSPYMIKLQKNSKNPEFRKRSGKVSSFDSTVLCVSHVTTYIDFHFSNFGIQFLKNKR